MVGGWGNVVSVLSIVVFRGNDPWRWHLVNTVYDPLWAFWRVVSGWVENVIVYIMVILLHWRGWGMFVRNAVHAVLSVGIASLTGATV